jgi:hypothetical protein
MNIYSWEAEAEKLLKSERLSEEVQLFVVR